jgi:hypothetical protein
VDRMRSIEPPIVRLSASHLGEAECFRSRGVARF